MNIEPTPWLHACVRLACLWALLDAMHHLKNRDLYQDGSILGWDLFKMRRPLWQTGPVASVLNRLCQKSGVSVFLVVQALSAGYLLIWPRTVFLLCIIWGCLLLHNLRVFPYYVVGCNRIAIIFFGGFAIAAPVLHEPAAQKAVLWFLALQSCLCYCVAGASKALETSWWTGEYLRKTLSLPMFLNNYRLIDRIAENRIFLCAISWGTILLEVCFPVSLLGFPVLTQFLIVCGISMHLSIGFFMRFPGFLLICASSYPAILFSAHSARFYFDSLGRFLSFLFF